MRPTSSKLTIGRAAIALAVGTTGTAFAVGGDDGEARATGPSAKKASTAALEITRGGKANSVERDSEDGATWEVEVTRPDGETVDVRLDERFALVVVERDSEAQDERTDKR